MPAQRPALILALLVTGATLLAGCTAPRETIQVDPPATSTPDTDVVEPQSVTGSTGAVGGSVTNTPPTFVSMTQSATTGENRGAFVVVFSGTVKDVNTENQVKNISIKGLGPSTLGTSHEITADEKNAATEPSSFGSDGWKVWTGTKNDGVLNYAYRQAFPAFTPAGTYLFTARVEDSPGASGISSTLSVVLTAFSDITISPVPVNAAGEALTGQNWGEWQAEAGATNVESANYIKLVNTGDVATSSVVIDFAGTFDGATDANFTIPVANNVQFAWFEDTTPGTTAPNEGTFTYGTANADGTVTVSFTAQNNVIYVKYRIVALPEIMPVQSYGIAFTVTEL